MAETKNLKVKESTTFDWNEKSTYIKKPPYFENFSLALQSIGDIEQAKSLLLLGNSVTTDHISPAGAIPPAYPAGAYLIEKDVKPEAFNSYGSRRGNHEVMMRGTFGNIRLKNQMVPGVEGGVTVHVPSGERMAIFDAAERYALAGQPENAVRMLRKVLEWIAIDGLDPHYTKYRPFGESRIPDRY